jgi:adenosine deaminase
MQPDAAEDRTEARIRALPKAELHVHIEGTLEPELHLAIARRNRIETRFETVEALRASYRFRDLASFLSVYYEGTRVLRTERDFYDLTRAYLERARDQNVRHAEIFFDPQTHTERGVPLGTVVNGIHRALEEGRQALGISSHLILCFLRDLGEERALAMLEQALRFRDRLVGVGLDSAELAHPPERFARVFARAREAGLRVVAHAGEEGPADYVRQALDRLGAERIDHGVRALEDPDLVRRLAREAIPLTVCPLSNVRLGVFGSMQEHNLKRLLDAGLKASIHSDDPAYFGGYVTENWLAAWRALHLDPAEIRALARNAFEASFLARARRQTLLAELERALADR